MDKATPQGRWIARNGRLNVVRNGLERHLLGDLYHFLLGSSWPLLLLLMALAFVGVNALFATLYLAGADSIEHARPGSFVDAFFFSVQTMATIGYGQMAPRTLFAHLVVTVEAFSGLLSFAVMTGLLFAKFSRPTARVMFSRVAVITARDGVPSLLFRMANERGNQIVEAQAHVLLARNEVTAEGEQVRRWHDLDLLRRHNPLFALSWTAIHRIIPGSPLYGETTESLAASAAEIVVSVFGTDETVSQTVHARYSYGAGNILWGARFVDILSLLPDGRRQIDFTRFHSTVSDTLTGTTERPDQPEAAPLYAPPPRKER